jgi:hypothetical protein
VLFAARERDDAVVSHGGKQSDFIAPRDRSVEAVRRPARTMETEFGLGGPPRGYRTLIGRPVRLSIEYGERELMITRLEGDACPQEQRVITPFVVGSQLREQVIEDGSRVSVALQAMEHIGESECGVSGVLLGTVTNHRAVRLGGVA